MSAAPSKLEQLNSKLAHAFGTAVGSVGMLVGENAAFTAQCAEVSYLKACDKIAGARDTARAMFMNY